MWLQLTHPILSGRTRSYVIMIGGNNLSGDTGETETDVRREDGSVRRARSQRATPEQTATALQVHRGFRAQRNKPLFFPAVLRDKALIVPLETRDAGADRRYTPLTDPLIGPPRYTPL